MTGKFPEKIVRAHDMVAITFINLPSDDCHTLTVYPPVGILSMGAVLKAEGHEVQFVDADVLHLSPEQACDKFLKPPQIVGIGLNVSQVPFVDKYLAIVRSRFPHALLVAGGPYVTGVGKKILEEFPVLDFAVVGEGEWAMVDIVRLVSDECEPCDVRNLIWRGPQEPIVNLVERISDLDLLPLPDYSLVERIFDKYSAPHPSVGSPSVAVMCTRGCPYSCAFCSSPTNWGRRLTLRSVGSVIKEVIALRKQFGVKEVFFQDDTLNARPSWFFELADAIIENNLHKEIYFRAPFRVNRAILTEKILEKAREAGFWLIFYGVENGNQMMLDRMEKRVNIADIRRAFEITRQQGLCSYASFMVGNEGETEETFEDSLALLREIRPDFGGFAVATPFPGSRLQREAKARGHITQLDFRNYRFGDAILRTEALSTSDIVRLTAKGNRVFNEIIETEWLRNYHFKRYLNYGVHPTEQWDRPVNRTDKKVSIAMPFKKFSRSVTFYFLADYPDIEARPVTLSLRVNGLERNIRFDTPVWRKVEMPIQMIDEEDFVFVTWEVDRTWNPKRDGIADDNRELGIAFSVPTC